MPTGPGLYSRAVAVLKVGLPLVALGMLSALFLIQTDDRLGPGLQFAPADLAALGNGLRISNPTFTGTTEGSDTFRFTAELVVPDAAPPTRASITAPAGELALRNGPVIELSARSGEVEIETSRLDLAGSVRIRTSDGYRIDTEGVTIDLGAGELSAPGPVESKGPLGHIEAGSLQIVPSAADAAETTRRFSFGNGVRVRYHPPPESE